MACIFLMNMLNDQMFYNTLNHANGFTYKPCPIYGTQCRQQYGLL